MAKDKYNIDDWLGAIFGVVLIGLILLIWLNKMYKKCIFFVSRIFFRL